jgi:hypothetical protein
LPGFTRQMAGDRDQSVADVFISYAAEDRRHAQSLAEVLTSQGHSVWWYRTMVPGDRFDEVIDTALKTSQAVVVLWSQASVQSAWVRDEASWARDHRRLIPAKVQRVEPPLGFRGIQTADLADWTGNPDAVKVAPLTQALERFQSSPAAVPGKDAIGTTSRREDTTQLRVASSAGSSWRAVKRRRKTRERAVELFLDSGTVLVEYRSRTVTSYTLHLNGRLAQSENWGYVLQRHEEDIDDGGTKRTLLVEADTRGVVDSIYKFRLTSMGRFFTPKDLTEH